MRTFSEGGPGVPFSLALPLDPLVGTGPAEDQSIGVLADEGSTVEVTAAAESVRLDLGRPKLDKEFLTLMWTATKVRGTNLLVSYSVDGGAWLPAVGADGADLPAGTHGKTVAYRISFIIPPLYASPSVDDITVVYRRWTGKPLDPGGGDDGDDEPKPGGKGDSGDGTYTFPGDNGGGSVASGGGSGEGTVGGGSGVGTGGAVAGSAAAVAASASTAGAAVPVPAVPESTGDGPAQTVNGVAVDPTGEVVGTPMVPDSSGGGGPASSRAGQAVGGLFDSLPVGSILAAAATLGLLLFLPWLVVARSMRAIVGFDRERARRWGPFGPLKG